MKDGERLWQNRRHCVFYLFLSAYTLVISTVDLCHRQIYFDSSCLLIWAASFWLRACVLKSCFDYWAGICGLLCFASECWCFFWFFVCFLCVFIFYFAKLASLLSWSFSQSILFHSLMFLSPPLLSIMLLLLFLQCILGTRKWSQMPRMR